MSWIFDIPPVIPVTPGGSSGDIQFNNGGAFAGSAATITSAGSINLPAGQTLDWNADAGISRLAADSLAIGNGTAGDFTGSLKLAYVDVEASVSGTIALFNSTDASTITAVRVVISGTHSKNVGLNLNDTGVNKWSIASYDNGHTNRDFTFYNTQTSSEAIGVNGDTNAVHLSGSLIQLGGTDAGISRLGAASLAIGNGTAGDKSGTISADRLLLSGADAYTVPQISVTNTSSSSVSLAKWINNSGVSFNLEMTGSAFSTGLNNAAFFFTSDNGATHASSMAFCTNGGVTSGGDTPIYFMPGGYDVCPSMAIQPSGVIQIGGTGKPSSSNLVFDTGISRLGAASLAVGNGTAGDFSGKLTLGSLVATAAAPTVAAAQIGYGSTVSATANTTGGGLTLPLLAAGYIIVNIAGTAYKVPYYAA